MNIFDLIRGFDEFTDVNELPTAQIVLWYALVTINNKTQWKDRFTVANYTLQIKTGLSKSGIIKARNALKQKGLIDFDTKSNQASSYSIIPFDKLEKDKTVDNNYQLSTQQVDGKDTASTQQVDGKDTASTPLIDKDNRLKTKTKTKDIKKEKQAKEKSPEEVLSELGLSDALTESILEFVENRKKNKDPMTNLAITKFVKNLKKLATDEQKQIELIDIAIINNWKNVFLPRENSFKNSPQKQNPGRPTQQVGEKYTVDDSTIQF